MTQLMVGAFYNPHLGAELARADGIDHLAMADPPAASDPWWPVIRERYTLLLHDYLGQISEPAWLRCFFEATGVGFLLDLPHVWLQAHYRDLDPERWLAEFPLERVVELHVAGVELDDDLQGPWIAPAEPSDEMLDFMAHAVSRCPQAKAVTFDAFSPSLTADVLFRSVERMRRAL